MNNNFNVNHVYPPINPGVRVWDNVEPEKHIVNMPEYPIYNYGVEPSPVQSCANPLPYVVPVGGERIEGFGNGNLLLKLLVLAALVYLVYYLLTNGVDNLL